MDAIPTTFLSVFLAEMGDRTQIMAAALALRYHKDGAIIAGHFPAIILRERLAQIIPLKPIRWASGALLQGWGLILVFRAFGIA